MLKCPHEKKKAVDVACSRCSTVVLTRELHPDASRPSCFRVWSFGDNSRGALGLNDASLHVAATPQQVSV